MILIRQIPKQVKFVKIILVLHINFKAKIRSLFSLFFLLPELKRLETQKCYLWYFVVFFSYELSLFCVYFFMKSEQVYLNNN